MNWTAIKVVAAVAACALCALGGYQYAAALYGRDIAELGKKEPKNEAEGLDQ